MIEAITRPLELEGYYCVPDPITHKNKISMFTNKCLKTTASIEISEEQINETPSNFSSVPWRSTITPPLPIDSQTERTDLSDQHWKSWINR